MFPPNLESPKREEGRIAKPPVILALVCAVFLGGCASTKETEATESRTVPAPSVLEFYSHVGGARTGSEDSIAAVLSWAGLVSERDRGDYALLLRGIEREAGKSKVDRAIKKMSRTGRGEVAEIMKAPNSDLPPAAGGGVNWPLIRLKSYHALNEAKYKEAVSAGQIAMAKMDGRGGGEEAGSDFPPDPDATDADTSSMARLVEEASDPAAIQNSMMYARPGVNITRISDDPRLAGMARDISFAEPVPVQEHLPPVVGAKDDVDDEVVPTLEDDGPKP